MWGILYIQVFTHPFKKTNHSSTLTSVEATSTRSAMFRVYKCHTDTVASALRQESHTCDWRREKWILRRDNLFLKPAKVSTKVNLFCILRLCFYQASELSQLDPGEGTSVSLVRAQECGGECSRSMFPLRRVSRAVGEWLAGWPFWLSSSCTRKLM